MRWERRASPRPWAQSAEFGGGLAVQRDHVGSGVQRVGEAVSLGAHGGMVADHHEGGEAFIQFLDHAVGMAGPFADQASHSAGSIAVIRLRPAVMGVLHPDFGGARGARAIDGGDGLAGHDLAEFGPVGMTFSASSQWVMPATPSISTLI